MKNHKIHLKHQDNKWHVREGNERLTCDHIIIFIQLTGDENGDLTGHGFVDHYGKDTLVLRNGDN